jgi:hypothetical protein
MVFIINLCCIGIEAQVSQVRPSRTGPGFDIVIAKKICDRSFAFRVEHSRPGMAFDEREPVLVCNPVAMPVRKGGLRDARISHNLRDGSALQTGGTEVVEDILDLGVSMDVMAAFHDRPGGQNH